MSLSKKLIRVPVSLVQGRWEFLYGGAVKVKEGASDIVQQTMLEAHRDFERFQGGSGQEWLAWLRRILAHNAADIIRHYRGTAKRQAGRAGTLTNDQKLDRLRVQRDGVHALRHETRPDNPARRPQPIPLFTAAP